MADLPALQFNPEPPMAAPPIPIALQDSLNVGEVVGAIWRHKLLLFTLFTLAFAGMAAVVLSLPSRYTSTALVLVNPGQTNLTNLPEVPSLAANGDVLAAVRSELQILQSAGLARQVVSDLDLDSNSEFQPKPSALSGLSKLMANEIGTAQLAPTPETREEMAFTEYQKDFAATNDGKSSIIEASFSAPDPAIARRVLSAHLRAYLDGQRNAKTAVIERVQHWLNDQLADMRGQVSASEQRLQALVNSSHLGQAEGATIGGRELAGTTTQLDEARADLARKQAHADNLAALARAGGEGAATSSDALASPVIQKLREQEAELTAQVSQLSATLGARHPSVVAAQAGRAGVQGKIRAELSRQAAAAAHDVSVASANMASAGQAAAAAELRVAGEDSATVTVNQIQRDLDAERRVYADLLERSKQLAIQGQVQEPDARIVSPPSLSLQPSSPRRGLLLMMSAAAAALLASAAALLRDRLGKRSQSLGDIEALCGLSGLGVIPRMGRGLLRRRDALLSRMSPLSALAAAVQGVRNSITFSGPGKAPVVIAFGSALPGEGKTTLVTCCGYSLAQAGQRVLLVDADLRRPGLTWLLSSRSHTGVVDVLEGRRSLRDAAVVVPRFGFDVLAVERAVANPHDLLQGPGLSALLNEARDAYDLVLIDTPPVSIVDDALAVMRLCDTTALVVRWGRTPYEAVWATARRLRLAQVGIAGAVLNAVDAKRYPASSKDLEAYRPSAGPYFLP